MLWRQPRGAYLIGLVHRRLTLKRLSNSGPLPNLYRYLWSLLLGKPYLLFNPGDPRQLCTVGLGLGQSGLFLLLLLGSNLSGTFTGNGEVDNARVVGRSAVSARGVHVGKELAVRMLREIIRGKGRVALLSFVNSLYMAIWNWASGESPLTMLMIATTPSVDTWPCQAEVYALMATNDSRRLRQHKAPEQISGAFLRSPLRRAIVVIIGRLIILVYMCAAGTVQEARAHRIRSPWH